MIGPALRTKCLILSRASIIDLPQISFDASDSLVLTSGRFTSAEPNQARKDVQSKRCCGVMRQIMEKMGFVYVSR